MVIPESTLRRIKQIIQRNYAQLSISVLGTDVFTPDELEALEAMGVDLDNKESLLELIYNHNFINSPIQPTSPTSLPDMKAQQSATGILPVGEAHAYTIQAENQKVREYLEKITLDVSSRIMGIIRDNNDAYKFDALANLDRSELADRLRKESSLGKVKQLLKDTSGNANRDWQRVALTEMSNLIGIGSVDRIVVDNQGKNLNEVYVYRIIVQDNVTCKHCRKFYGDVGQVPKLYRLSTLLANGSNYGKPQQDWAPCIGATHPNTRTSQIVELRAGFKIVAGGSQTYIGLEKWQDWVFENLQS